MKFSTSRSYPSLLTKYPTYNRVILHIESRTHSLPCGLLSIVTVYSRHSFMRIRADIGYGLIQL